jgi:hypothetical protein
LPLRLVRLPSHAEIADRQPRVILARHAVGSMTSGLPSATDDKLQRGELAKSAISGHWFRGFLVGQKRTAAALIYINAAA